MAFHVRDQATDVAVRRLAKLKGKTLTATIREAVEHEYERERCGEDDFMTKVKTVQEAYRALGPLTGKLADKAFYDNLSGEDELSGER